MNKSFNAIRVESVGKSFRVYHDKAQTMKERILFRRNSYTEHVVLDNINISVGWGKTIGLIGRNGSGKSTLLKLMTGIIFPDSGEIEVFGKVSSLLELGAGFHPDFSGRDNVYNNGAIFGLTKKQIDQRFDDIIDFSELHEFIDNPVRTYSSGMYMRLAFSVAINVDAEIILIDEILSVGDASFQKKCFDRIKELQKAGKTFVIVTHALGTIRDFCNEVLWLENGEVCERGTPADVLPKYIAALE